jgi:hypothetical protein
MSIAAVNQSSADLANLATGMLVTAPAAGQRSDTPDHEQSGDDRVELSTAAHAANRGPSASAAAAVPTPTVAAPGAALPGIDVTA